ncbi:MAG: mechanosensitive ion channel family protein, partial [bacterium]|nr:mechanosensitive ion channel family protein [bacterium]
MNSNTLSSDLSQSDALSSIRSVLIIPCSIIILAMACHYCYHYYVLVYLSLPNVDLLTLIEGVVYDAILSGSTFWIINRLIHQSTHYLLNSNYGSSHQLMNILFYSLAKITKGIAFIIIFNLFLQNLQLPSQFSLVLNKISSMLVISATGWILLQLINSSEQFLLHRYTAKSHNQFTARKFVTQLLILKRIAFIIIAVLVSGSILMLFDNVKALGASVLTTAGIFGLVITFTAQKTLGGLFSGLEIALTQPIKIGDAVVIENEFGIGDEINFSS